MLPVLAWLHRLGPGMIALPLGFCTCCSLCLDALSPIIL